MRPYKGVPELKQLPATKENYKGKNMSGGRKAAFSQSREYKVRGDKNYKNERNEWASGVSKIASPWYGWEA